MKATNTWNVQTPNKENIPWYKLAEGSCGREFENSSERKCSISQLVTKEGKWRLDQEWRFTSRRDRFPEGIWSWQVGRLEGTVVGTTYRNKIPIMETSSITNYINCVNLFHPQKGNCWVWGKGWENLQKSQAQKARFRVKQFATNYNMEIKHIAS